MKKIEIILFTLLLILSSCKMSEIILPQDLDNSAIRYDVKKKGKFKWKEKLAFGDYVVKESKKSFPWILESEWIFTEAKGRHQIQFEISNFGTGDIYEVFAKNDISTISIGKLTKLFNIVSDVFLNVEDCFIGSIKSEDKLWNFVISNMSTSSFRYANGYVTDGTKTIEIKQAEEVSDGWLPKKSGETIVYGFIFQEKIGREKKYLGAVRTYKDGRIWIDEDLDMELSDIIAAMSAALLLNKGFN